MADVVSAAVLFALLWDTLADVLGTAATATLLNRAIRRTEERCPAIRGLAVERTGLTYNYRVPESWHLPASEEASAAPDSGDSGTAETAGSMGAFRSLVDELRPLLLDLTGLVLVRRLDRLAEFGEQGIVFTQTPVTVLPGQVQGASK
jgi:hypothetical protein